MDKAFIKYLSQYLLLLILPITILILFFFRVTLNSFTNEVLIRQEENLRMTQEVFDDLLRRTVQLNNEIETDTVYSPNYISLGLVNTMEVQKRLEKLSRQSLYINDIFVYYHGLDTVISNHGHYTYSDFLRYGVEFESMDGSDLGMFIQENQYTAVIPRQHIATNRGQPVLAMGIAATFREHSDFYRQTVLCIIDCSLLERQLIGHYEEFAGSTLIVSGNELIGQFGNIVFSGDQLEEIFTLLKESVSEGGVLLKLDKKSYMVQITHSGYFGIDYISIIDQQTLNNKLHSQINAFSLALLVVLLLGIPVISFYMLKNYVPLRDLQTFIRLNFEEDTVHNSAVVAARQAIEQLQAEKQNLLGSSMEQWLNLRHHAVLDLLYGQEPSNPEMDDVFSLGKDKYSMVQVLACRNDSPQDQSLNQIAGLLDELKALPLENTKLLATYGNADLRIIIILLYREKGVDKVLRDIRCFFEQKNLGELVFGTQEGSYSRLWRSFLSIYGSENQQDTREDGQITLFDQALRHEQYNQALKLLAVICEKLEKESTSLFQVRCACYRLSDSILHAMRLNRGILEKQGLDLFSIAQETDMQILITHVEKLAETACSGKAANLEENGLELFIQSIHNYVAEHLETPGFSIQSMADHFNISVTSLSRRYKEAAGANISDYIGKQVMDQAMELLKSSDIRISELAERFRFSTSSGFISFFKQRAGVTPGVYQKIFRDNNAADTIEKRRVALQEDIKK